jgi:hypothetical protein
MQVCVQGIKPLLKKVTLWRLRGSFDIWFIPQLMGFGILKARIYLFVVSRIRIGPVTRMIGNQPPELANFLEGLWCVGLLRSKIVYLSPPPKPTTLPLQVDALNYCG